MDININDCLAVGFSEGFLNTIPYKSDTVPKKSKYSLLLINEGCVINSLIYKAETVICPCIIAIRQPIKCNRIITCGMRPSATLSFSCIGEDRAILSLTRMVGKANPGEVGVRYRQDLTVYENLVYQALRLINIR